MSAVATQQDRLHMKRALELAEGGRGRVSPNPLVGAVVVKGTEVVGEGFHARFGGPHAEVAALEDCRRRGTDPRGSTLYVTLEPCAHHGKQPPCTGAIVAAGVGRVVIGSEDPSEKAGGRGPGILRDEGIEVELAEGAEATAARLLNQPFRKRARTGRPHVVLKSALSLDGRVATASGESKWISGADSRALVHGWRAEADAVAVGIETALTDDPLLTARTPDAARQPTRIVFDSRARLPLDSILVRSAWEAPVVVVTGSEAPQERVRGLEAAGVEVLTAGGRRTRIELALAELGRREISSLMLEGGPTLAGSFLTAGEVDELRLFIAPLVLGGGRSLFEGRGPERIAEAQRTLATEWEQVGDDLLVRARLREW